MDNVRFHKTNLIVEQIEASGHKILFLPPYSPFLNPIEELFHQVKSIVSHKVPSNQEQLMKCIMDSPDEIYAHKLLNYSNHVESYFTRCLNSE